MMKKRMISIPASYHSGPIDNRWTASDRRSSYTAIEVGGRVSGTQDRQHGFQNGERSPRQPRDNKIVNKREHPLSKAADDAPREHTLQNRASRERLRLIARVTGRVVGTEPLDRQARAMAEEVRAIFKTDACVIRLLEGQDLVLLGAAGIPAENLYERIPLECGISQDILRSPPARFRARRPHAPDHRDAAEPVARGFEFVCGAGTPLLVGDRPLGIYRFRCGRTSPTRTRLSPDHRPTSPSQ